MKHCLYCGAILEDDYEGNICDCCKDDGAIVDFKLSNHTEATDEEFKYYYRKQIEMYEKLTGLKFVGVSK